MAKIKVIEITKDNMFDYTNNNNVFVIKKSKTTHRTSKSYPYGITFSSYAEKISMSDLNNIINNTGDIIGVIEISENDDL